MADLGTPLSPIEAEFYEGYRDGHDADSPEPSANRHPAYRHSWEVGRAERIGKPIPAVLSRARAAHIEAGGNFYGIMLNERQIHEG